MSNSEGETHTPKAKSSNASSSGHNTRFAGTKIPNTKFNQNNRSKVTKANCKSKKNRSASRDTLNDTNEGDISVLNLTSQSNVSNEDNDGIPLASTHIDFSSHSDNVVNNDGDKSIHSDQGTRKSNISILIDEQNSKATGEGLLEGKRNSTSGIVDNVRTKMGLLPELYDYEDKEQFSKFCRISIYEQNKCILEAIDYLKENEALNLRVIKKFEKVRAVNNTFAKNERLKLFKYLQIELNRFNFVCNHDGMHIEGVVELKGWKNFDIDSMCRPYLGEELRENIMAFSECKFLVNKQICLLRQMDNLAKIGVIWDENEVNTVFDNIMGKDDNVMVNSFYSWVISEIEALSNDLYVANDNTIPVSDHKFDFVKCMLVKCSIKQAVDYELALHSDRIINMEDHLDKFCKVMNKDILDMNRKNNRLFKELHNEMEKIHYGSDKLSEKQKAAFSDGLQILVAHANELIELPNKFDILNQAVNKNNELLTSLIKNGGKSTKSVSIEEVSSETDIILPNSDDIPVGVINKRLIPGDHNEDFRAAPFMNDQKPSSRVSRSDLGSHRSVNNNNINGNDNGCNNNDHETNDNSNDRGSSGYRTRTFRRSRAPSDPGDDPEVESHSKNKKSNRQDAFKASMPTWHEMIDLKLRDYRDFEHEFRTEFEGFDYKERLTRSILCMKQDKNTSPTVFIANMYKRIKYCEGFKSEDEAVRMIRTALNPFWKKQLLIYNCKSVLDIFRACQEIMQLNRSDLEVNDNKLFNFVPDCDITNEHKNDIDSRLVPLDPMLYREKGAKIFADKRKFDKDSNSHKFVRTFDKIKTLRSFPNKFNKGKFDNNKKKVWVNKQQGSGDTNKQTSHFENKQTYSKPNTHSHQDSTQNKGNGGSWKSNNFDKNKTAAKPSFPLDGKPSWRANCVFCEGPHDVRECHELLELQVAVNEAGPEGSDDEEEAINDLENDKNDLEDSEEQDVDANELSGHIFKCLKLAHQTHKSVSE